MSLLQRANHIYWWIKKTDMTPHILSRFLGTFLAVCAVLAAFVGQPAQAATETVTYYHNDVLGSPVAATDASGNLLWRETYRPYGERLNNQAPSDDNPIWYTGKRQDAETGLVYMGSRYYDPRLGRFLSIDPVEPDENNLHSLNRYAYANNNPYKFTDPDGQHPFLVLLAFGLEMYNLTNSDGVPGGGLTKAGANTAGKLANKGEEITQTVKQAADRGAAKAGEGVEQGRDALGRFLPKNGGEVAPGSGAEKAVWDAVRQKPGWSVVEGRVTVKNAAGDVRVYDGVAISPKNRAIGLEVKSGAARKTGSQRAFDSGVSTSSPAQGVGRHSEQTIVRSVEIRVPR